MSETAPPRFTVEDVQTASAALRDELADPAALAQLLGTTTASAAALLDGLREPATAETSFAAIQQAVARTAFERLKGQSTTSDFTQQRTFATYLVLLVGSRAKPSSEPPSLNQVLAAEAAVQCCRADIEALAALFMTSPSEIKSMLRGLQDSADQCDLLDIAMIAAVLARMRGAAISPMAVLKAAADVNDVHARQLDGLHRSKAH